MHGYSGTNENTGCGNAATGQYSHASTVAEGDEATGATGEGYGDHSKGHPAGFFDTAAERNRDAKPDAVRGAGFFG